MENVNRDLDKYIDIQNQNIGICKSAVEQLRRSSNQVTSIYTKDLIELYEDHINMYKALVASYRYVQDLHKKIDELKGELNAERK